MRCRGLRLLPWDHDRTVLGAVDVQNGLQAQRPPSQGRGRFACCRRNTAAHGSVSKQPHQRISSEFFEYIVVQVSGVCTMRIVPYS